MNATGFGIDALSFKMGFDKTLIPLLTPLLTLLKIIGKKIQSVVQIFINTQIIQLSQIAIEPPKNKSNCATAHTEVETAQKSIDLPIYFSAVRSIFARFRLLCERSHSSIYFWVVRLGFVEVGFICVWFDSFLRRSIYFLAVRLIFVQSAFICMCFDLFLRDSIEFLLF